MTKNNAKPRILIIYTGGTIGMIEDPVSKVLKPFDFSHLIDNVPKITKLDFEIGNIQFDPPIDSSNMNPSHWSKIAREVEANYDNYDGFVVLHGTDTMAYTASALSFMLENLDKPVIITGSQLPIGEVRTDGEENLLTALQIAAARNTKGEAMIREVAILFENHLLRGNRSSKVSADNFNAFMSNNYPELASIGLGISYREKVLYRSDHNRPLIVHETMDTNVMFIVLHPGLTREMLEYQLNTPSVKGIVLMTYGAGNSPSDEWFTKPIAQAVERGIVILNVTQCGNGSVNSTLYDTGNTLARAGVISGHDITSEAAITKMMYLFGKGMTTSQVKKYLQRDICGEMTVDN